MEQVQYFLDRLFSLFVFIVILLLACYMGVRIAGGGYIFFQSTLSGEYLSEDFLMNVANKRALHSIAEVIILIKAYRILVSYLKTHHMSVEYIVEISIIAPAIELIFAADSYELSTQIVFAVFGLVNLFFYLYFFGPEHDEELHRHITKHNNHSQQ